MAGFEVSTEGVGQDGSQGGGPCVMSSWTAASSDCSRPMNNYVHVKTADLYRPNARLTPERQGYQVLTPFGKLGYSRELGIFPAPVLVIRAFTLTYPFRT